MCPDHKSYYIETVKTKQGLNGLWLPCNVLIEAVIHVLSSYHITVCLNPLLLKKMFTKPAPTIRKV